MKILFCGDSITDAGRARVDGASTGLGFGLLGMGYAFLVSAHLGYAEPGKYEFINRGISGDRIVDIYARMKKDIISLKPDVMSIFVGVNDAWHDFAEIQNGVSPEKFYKVYDMLIEEVKQELPDIKIMIIAPASLRTYEDPEKNKAFNEEVKKRAEMAKKIADKYNLPFVELQKGFDELSKKEKDSYWLLDGVHPSPMGHEFIKNKWLEAFYEMMK